MKARADLSSELLITAAEVSTAHFSVMKMQIHPHFNKKKLKKQIRVSFFFILGFLAVI